MRIKLMAMVLGVAAVALIALACTETTVLPPDREPPGVTVSGEGSVFGEPDVARLSLGVDVEASTVGDARARAAEAMNAMLDALKDGGVEEEDIQTTRFTVQPRYDFVDGRRELRGFAVSNVVTAKIRNIDDTGQLIDEALSAGGDLARIESLSFTIDDPSALEDEARRLAVVEARSKAETLADEAGASLGPPRSISETRAPMPITFDEVRALEVAEDLPDTPIQLGELEVRVQVQVVYELE